MFSYRDIYFRFIENYRTETGGINLYPQFDSDLELLLEWLSDNDDSMGDVGIDGSWLPAMADCGWQPPIGEDD